MTITVLIYNNNNNNKEQYYIIALTVNKNKDQKLILKFLDKLLKV